MSSSEDEASDEEICQCPHSFHRLTTNREICGPALEGSKGCRRCVQIKGHGQSYHSQWQSHGSEPGDRWAEGHEEYEKWENSITQIERSKLSRVGPYRHWLKHEGGREIMGLNAKPRRRSGKNKNKAKGKNRDGDDSGSTPNGVRRSTRLSKRNITTLSSNTLDADTLRISSYTEPTVPQEHSAAVMDDLNRRFLSARSLSSADCGISSDFQKHFPNIQLPSHVHLRHKSKKADLTSSSPRDSEASAQGGEKLWYPVDPLADDGVEDFDEEDELWVAKAMGDDR
ncbi:hypothetical protein I302_102618 [Kwoniella bestiolae CBS 10118]|uniref:Uncharacterized protein n=1 Tax=Kwoniella bestiolae CBS 10118 TaxID=1296100 RepID=A0A1B9GFH2_9TREE|nr:hypothetical protein I302_01306 [Kwoniella bestiolae CBS 10118]OCF29793.1 hypothetical protein I302_01306 [Kwoniella bestiolae CBS 10118]